MPLGTTNGSYSCDECGKPMPVGTEAWIDLEESKIFCLDCRTEDGERREKAARAQEANALEANAPLPSGPKTVVIRHESSKVEALQKQVAALKAENKQLKADMKSLRKSARILLELQKEGRVRGKVVKELTLEDELIRLRRSRGTTP